MADASSLFPSSSSFEKEEEEEREERNPEPTCHLAVGGSSPPLLSSAVKPADKREEGMNTAQMSHNPSFSFLFLQ